MINLEVCDLWESLLGDLGENWNQEKSGFMIGFKNFLVMDSISVPI